MSGFPIMGWKVATWLGTIPFEVIAPHEAQAQRNHGQSLKQLAARGGLTPCEAVAVLEDRPWRQMDHAEAEARLRELVVGTPTPLP